MSEIKDRMFSSTLLLIKQVQIFRALILFACFILLTSQLHPVCDYPAYDPWKVFGPINPIPTLSGLSNKGNFAWPENGFYNIPYNDTFGTPVYVDSKGNTHSNVNAGVQILVLFVDFPNFWGSTNPLSIPAICKKSFDYDGTNNGLIAEWTKQSYGKLTVTMDFVTNWLRMPYNAVPNTGYPMAWPADASQPYIFRDAMAAATNKGYYMGNYDTVFVVFPQGVHFNSPASGIFPPYVTNIPAPPRGAVTFGDDAQGFWGRKQHPMHEVGHNMGIGDLYMYASFGSDAANPDLPGPLEILKDNWQAVNFTSWIRHLWGWLSPERKTFISSGTYDYELTPLEGTNGVSMITLPGPNYPDDVLVLENQMPWTNTVKRGVMIYQVNSTNTGGQGAFRVKFPPGVTNSYATNVFWQPGFIYTNAATGSRVEVLSSNGNNYNVRVYVGP